MIRFDSMVMCNVVSRLLKSPFIMTTPLKNISGKYKTLKVPNDNFELDRLTLFFISQDRVTHVIMFFH